MGRGLDQLRLRLATARPARTLPGKGRSAPGATKATEDLLIRAASRGRTRRSPSPLLGGGRLHPVRSRIDLVRLQEFNRIRQKQFTVTGGAPRLLRCSASYLTQKIFVLRVTSHIAAIPALRVDNDSGTATEPWPSIRSRWIHGYLEHVGTRLRNSSKEKSPLQSIVFGKIAGSEFLCSHRGGLQRDHRAPPPVHINSQ